LIAFESRYPGRCPGLFYATPSGLGGAEKQEVKPCNGENTEVGQRKESDSPLRFLCVLRAFALNFIAPCKERAPSERMEPARAIEEEEKDN